MDRLATVCLELVSHLRDRETPGADDATLVVPENAAGPTLERREDDLLRHASVDCDLRRSNRIPPREQVNDRGRDAAALLVEGVARGRDRLRKLLNGRDGRTHCRASLILVGD